MNILVTGANGQLGNEMRLVAKDSAHHFIFSDITSVDGQETTILDITDSRAVEETVRKENIKAIVNCAAFTDVEGAEEKQALAGLLNANAPAILAEAMKKVDGMLVHISTDYVFGKESYNTPCNEEMSGTPTGVYGLTKLQGENNIKASGCRYIIIRTAWLYSEFGKNFVKTMLRLTSTKPELKVVCDQVGTPTYALDLAKAIARILEDESLENATGIYHFSNEGVCSWYDFTKMIAEYSGNTACMVLPCRSDEFPSKVTRPSYSVLDKTKIKNIFGVTVPYWTDSLKQCLGNMKELK